MKGPKALNCSRKNHQWVNLPAIRKLRAIQTVQGQIRALRSSSEHRYKCTIKEDHCIWPWLIMYAGILINICLVGDDGRTAYERRKGRKFKRDLPEIGECIWYLRARISREKQG